MNQSKDNEISTISKITLLITGISLVVSIFVPLWRIDLDAPQYPEVYHRENSEKNKSNQ